MAAALRPRIGACPPSRPGSEYRRESRRLGEPLLFPLRRMRHQPPCHMATHQDERLLDRHIKPRRNRHRSHDQHGRSGPQRRSCHRINRKPNHDHMAQVDPIQMVRDPVQHRLKHVLRRLLDMRVDGFPKLRLPNASLRCAKNTHSTATARNRSRLSEMTGFGTFRMIVFHSTAVRYGRSCRYRSVWRSYGGRWGRWICVSKKVDPRPRIRQRRRLSSPSRVARAASVDRSSAAGLRR
jgi:hypothetical protein